MGLANTPVTAETFRHASHGRDSRWLSNAL
jgi:hypothetical protein